MIETFFSVGNFNNSNLKINGKYRKDFQNDVITAIGVRYIL